MGFVNIYNSEVEQLIIEKQTNEELLQQTVIEQATQIEELTITLGDLILG